MRSIAGRPRRWRLVATTGMLAALLLAAACGGDGTPDDGSPGGSPTPGTAPTTTDGLTDVSCVDGEYRVGEWSVPRTGEPATVAGLAAAAAGDDCAVLRIRFTGTAPGVDVVRLPVVNETYLRFTGGGTVSAVPVGPVPEDVIQPGFALLDHALIGYDDQGLHVHVGHGLHPDVSARVVLADRHVDVYFRLARAEDGFSEVDWAGDANPVALRSASDLRLAMLNAYIGDFATPGEIHFGGPVTVVGYAKAPESGVMVRVYADDTLVCEQAVHASGPPYLFSRFGYRDEGCLVDERSRTWTVEVGWPDAPDGPGLWQRYDFTWVTEL